MTDDETILREVDSALAEDKQADALRKNLPALIGGAALIIVGVGGWQFWDHRKEAKATENALEFRNAVDALSTGDETAAASFEKIAAEGAGGYATLAKLRLAAIHTGKGEREPALALLREIYSSSSAPKRLKDLARIRAAYLSIDAGRDAVIKDAGPLETDTSALGFYAREILGLAALKAGDYQSAEEIFRKAASAVAAPEPVRKRAEEFAALASAGKSGIELGVIEDSGKSQVDLALERLKAAGDNLGAVLEKASPPGVQEDASADEAPPQEKADDSDTPPAEQGSN